jgi:hypothetical protein
MLRLIGSRVLNNAIKAVPRTCDSKFVNFSRLLCTTAPKLQKEE